MRKFIFCLLFLAMMVEPIAIYAQPKSVRKKSGQITKVITDVEQIVVELEQSEALSMDAYQARAKEAKELLLFCQKQLTDWESKMDDVINH